MFIQLYIQIDKLTNCQFVNLSKNAEPDYLIAAVTCTKILAIRLNQLCKFANFQTCKLVRFIYFNFNLLGFAYKYLNIMTAIRAILLQLPLMLANNSHHSASGQFLRCVPDHSVF